MLELGEDGNDFGLNGMSHEKAQYGWNWLEHWMSSQPYHVRHHSAARESYVTPTTTTTATDDMSEKTVEMDPIALAQLNLDSVEPGPYPARRPQQRQSISKNNVPSYMAPTQSARAKVRSRGSGCDSSSSGGGTVTYRGPRSPTPVNNGARFSPAPSHVLACGEEDWALPLGPWRPAFAS